MRGNECASACCLPPTPWLQVSHLDEVAMGTEERQELETKIDELEDKVGTYELVQCISCMEVISLLKPCPVSPIDAINVMCMFM